MVPHQHRTITAAEDDEKGRVNNSTMPFSSFAARNLLPRAGQVLVIGVPVLVLVLFVLYPLAAIILQSIFPQLYAIPPSFVPSFVALKQVAANSENYKALINSLWLAGTTAVLACLLGTTLAILARRTDLPLSRAMDTLVWIVFFVPSFLIGEAWSLAMLRGGIPDQYLHFSDATINWFFSMSASLS